MAEKSVALVTLTSSSGETQKIPAGRRWEAQLRMLTFAIGIIIQQWHGIDRDPQPTADSSLPQPGEATGSADKEPCIWPFDGEWGDNKLRLHRMSSLG